MQKTMCIRASVAIVVSLCATLCASVEGLFTGIEPPPPTNGLVLEIAVQKNTYFFFEPVTVFARLRNITDAPMAVVLERYGLEGIDSKLSWEFSSPDGKTTRPSVYSSTLQNAFLILEHGTLYFALPDKMFQIGKTKVAITYGNALSYPQPPLAGAQVWQGEVKSNELEIVVQDKAVLTPEERKLVDEKIRRHIELFKSDDEFTRYRAEGQLVRLAKYSVPILVECLKDRDAGVRAHAIAALGRIANKGLAEELGFQRDVSSLDALIAAYGREPDPATKAKAVYALASFKDVSPERRASVVQVLRKAINHTDKPLRMAAGIVLLRFSKEDGIPEVIDKMKDPTYFGEDGQGIVLSVLQEETGQKFGASSKEWQAWWEKNKPGGKK